MTDGSKKCNSGVARIYRAEADHVKVLAINLRCGRWDCPDCAEHKADLIRDRLKKFIAEKQTWMYTFTFYQDIPPKKQWQRMPKVWNLFRTRIAQKYGRFNYIRVVECHKNTPYPHMHVVADVDISDTDFGKIAVESGFGYQLKKRKCDDRAPHYITKYLTKAWENKDGIFLRQKTKTRVVSWSRGLSKLWSLPPQKPTVAVHAATVLTSAPQYETTFKQEFPDGVIITHQNTYRRGHIWHISHPNYSPLDLLRAAELDILYPRYNDTIRSYCITRLPPHEGGEIETGIISP